MKPDFAKGYQRVANALFGLKQYPKALQAIVLGLKFEPKNKPMNTLKE